ncbi:putative lipoprotein [Tannerella forsythia KS16]|nr:putative lipoprotein [Tannerella forsythia KS16]
MLARTDEDRLSGVKVNKLSDVRMSFPARGFIHAYTSDSAQVEITLAFAYPMTEYGPYTLGIFLYCLSYRVDRSLFFYKSHRKRLEKHRKARVMPCPGNLYHLY